MSQPWPASTAPAAAACAPPSAALPQSASCRSHQVMLRLSLRPPIQLVADAYAARRLLEIEIVRLLAARIGASEIALLRQHVRQQADAERRGDKVSFVRLLTDFHLLLAALSDNVFLKNFVYALASITALGVLVYDQDSAPSCAVDDHRALIRSLERRDSTAAALQMSSHLGHNHARQSTVAD